MRGAQSAAVLLAALALAGAALDAQQRARRRAQGPLGESSPPESSPPERVAPPVVRTTEELLTLAASLDVEELLARRANQPVIRVEDGALVYYEGDMPALGDEVIGPVDVPLLVPLARAVQLQDLERHLAAAPGTDPASWRPRLLLAHAILEQKSLALLAEGGLAPLELYDRLLEIDQHIDHILHVEVPEELARAHGLQLRRPSRRMFAAHRTSVVFVLDPPGARLYVIPSTFFTPDGKFDFMWRQILEEKPMLGGSYHYRAVWPDGAVAGPSPLRVDTANQVFTISR